MGCSLRGFGASIMTLRHHSDSAIPPIFLKSLVVFYWVIYRVITEFYPKPLIWARVAVKCTIAVKLPPLLAYPTLPYLTALLKSSFRTTEKAQNNNDTSNATIRTIRSFAVKLLRSLLFGGGQRGSGGGGVSAAAQRRR